MERKKIKITLGDKERDLCGTNISLNQLGQMVWFCVVITVQNIKLRLEIDSLDSQNTIMS